MGQELRIPLVAAEEREPRVPPGVVAYRVRPGDTLVSLSQRFGLSPLELVSANPSLESLDRLVAGSVIYIPKGAKGLLVALPEGETLVSLALRFGLSPVKVAQANGVKDPTALRPGDLVLLPGIQAKTTYQRLLAKQEEERRARLEAERRRQEELRRLAEERRRQEAQRQARLRQAQAPKPQVRRVSYQEGGMRWPLSGFQITTYFGQRGAFQRFHTGIDLAAPYGTPHLRRQGRPGGGGGLELGGLRFPRGPGPRGRGGDPLRPHVPHRRAGRRVGGGGAGDRLRGSTGWSTGPTST